METNCIAIATHMVHGGIIVLSDRMATLDIRDSINNVISRLTRTFIISPHGLELTYLVKISLHIWVSLIHLTLSFT